MLNLVSARDETRYLDLRQKYWPGDLEARARRGVPSASVHTISSCR